MDSIKPKQIIYGVQYLRGIAALGVLFCHYGSGLNNYPLLSSIFNWGQNGVQLFFLISGFIIVYSLTRANYTVNLFFTFLLKRSIRIDPAYYATILLTLGLFYVLSLIPSFGGAAIPFIPQQFLAHLLYVIPFTKYNFYNHVFWTLCVEFQFYLIIGLLYFLTAKRLYKLCFMLTLALSCLINFANAYYLIFNYAPVFCLGIVLIDFYNKKTSIYHYGLVAVFMGLIAFKFSLEVLLLLSAGSFIILGVSIYNKLLFMIGNISYSLYLTHGLTLIILVGVFKRFHFDLAKNQLFWLGIEVIIALMVSYLFYICIEKPSLKLSKKIFYKNKA